MLEVLYSSGIRRNELARLDVVDVDTRRGSLLVREGKGRRDRLVPLGERACRWVEKYLAEVRPELLAPNGFLHAGTVITLADTACGYACMSHLPEGAANFTTLELKCNFLGTTTEGELRAVARAAHLGRSTQVWDATVYDGADRAIALFRCTQMVLHRRG